MRNRRTRETLFRHGRHIRSKQGAPAAGGREKSKRPRLGMRRDREEIGERKVDAAADDVGDRRHRSLVRHVDDLNARGAHQHRPRDLRAGCRHRERDFTRVGTCVVEKTLRALPLETSIALRASTTL
jgi:hypothetical protein